ncbi:HAMP domain-containing sensor histidine kinase [Sphingobium sp.]|uniref:sensor histidine kinase n=1 Tax=Sphingobium sp. TaxID=1912891 RepID=UPI002C4F37AE|nr:HAMP domain-containing sensor histidine kinase [Sphingobium sp.]HUD93297.1 HAMP domain-containing sensor histidine kinase [Sphingobium sp.]
MSTVPVILSFKRLLPRADAEIGWRTLLLLAAYPIAFKLAHIVASPWGGAHYFSLWFPAAGVRFALLWQIGARYTPVILAEECLIQLMTGTISLAHPEFFNHLCGVARAPLSYGIMVALVRLMERRGRSELAIAPMPFGLAAVLAPTLASFSAGLSEWVWPGISTDMSNQPFATTIAAFLVGDLLGVLLIAPPLLWISNIADRSLPSLPPVGRMGEAGAVFGIGWLLAGALAAVEPQIAVTPVLIGTIWAGLRCGRHGAWVAIMISAAVILPWSASLTSTATRFSLHMSLAAMAIAAYLAGSFAEAQLRARQDIARRDRILFQAERLKTLRAMSVAIIHEISQPLSTLAIETRHLAALGQQPDPDMSDMRESIALVESKATLLANMVRRLRSFGGRAVDEPSAIPVGRLLRDCASLVAGEARSLGCSIDLPTIHEAISTVGHEIEITQILLNLVRNAMLAAPGTVVGIEVDVETDMVAIHVTNAVRAQASDYGGMGIGLLVARAIADAHGGALTREKQPGRVRHSVRLPLAGAKNG